MFKFRKNQFLGVGMLAVAVIATAGYTNYAETHETQTYTVQFDRGTRLAADQEKIITQAVSRMFQNSAYTARGVGHTGTQGDHDANVMLAEQRAETIKKMMVDQEVKPKRIETFGAGGADPLAKKDNESVRAYQGRLSRATIVLRSE
jgi:outer membrane protein OmpA-like peptidoglycan-associated protein